MYLHTHGGVNSTKKRKCIILLRIKNNGKLHKNTLSLNLCVQHINPRHHVQNSNDAAIIIHATATYGDLRSPILASFQKTPNSLSTKRMKSIIYTQ